MNVKGYLDDLQNKYGDFCVSCLYKENGEEKGNKAWLSWLKVRDDDKYISKIKHREILKPEIVLDLEDKEKYSSLIEQLNREGYYYKAYSTGSKGYHIHLFFRELNVYDDNERKKVKEFFIKKFGCDIQKAGKCMIALEGVEHWKGTGKIKELVAEREGNNKLDNVLSEINEKDEQEQYKDFIYDENELPKDLHSVMGLWNGIRYYGMMVPKKEVKDITTKDGVFLFSKEIVSNKLCLLTSDRKQLEVDHNFTDKNKLIVSEPPLLRKNRMQLEKIELWLKKKEEFEFNLLEKIKDKYKNSLYFNDERWLTLHGIWDIGTYFFDLFNKYPYIENVGLKGTAKTKTMRISELISFNGKYYLKPTAATLFRYVERNKCSLFIDEVENLFKISKGKIEQDDIVELLNGGYQKGAVVPRWDKDNSGKWVLKEYDAYCPKQFASIKGLSGLGALQSRSITHVHIKAPVKDERSQYWPEEVDPFFRNIRNELYFWGLTHWQKVNENYQNMNKEFKLDNRDWDLWKPLLAIAKIFGEDCYKELGEFGEEVSESADSTSLESDKWEYKVIEIMIELLCMSEAQPCKITAEGIRINLKEKIQQSEYLPNNDMIGRFISSIGFKDFKKRGNPNYFLLSKNKVREILQTQNILTQDTLDTLFKEKIEEKVNV